VGNRKGVIMMIMTIINYRRWNGKRRKNGRERERKVM
jgi:hypothetical protein